MYWRWVGSLLLSKVISLTGTYIIHKNHHKYAQLFKNSWKTMKVSSPWARKSVLQSNSCDTKCVKEKGREGNLSRSALNCCLWARGSAQKWEEAQTVHFLQGVCWENILARNLEKQSSRNHSLCFMENKNGQWNKTPGRTGVGHVYRTVPDQSLDSIQRNSGP